MSTTVSDPATAVDPAPAGMRPTGMVMPSGAIFRRSYGAPVLHDLADLDKPLTLPDTWCPMGGCLEDIGSPDCPHGALHQASPAEIVRRSPVNNGGPR